MCIKELDWQYWRPRQPVIIISYVINYLYFIYVGVLKMAVDLHVLEKTRLKRDLNGHVTRFSFNKKS